MKSRSKSSSSDEGSIDTDTTLDTSLNVGCLKLSWTDFIGYYHFVAGFAVFYISWFVLNRNLFIPLWYYYVLVPVIDVLIPLDHQNLSHEQAKVYEKDKRFMLPLYLFFVLDFATYFWGIYMFAFGDFHSIYERILFTIVIAHLGAIGMVVGHELLHRKQLIHKICGTLFYSKVLYSHFLIEHTKGHHKNVSTPLDPASSRLGETLYQFLPKTFFGSYRSVWSYESKRLKRKKIPESPWSLSNRLISFNIGHALFLIAVSYFFGVLTLFFALCYGFINIFFLETINYIEHYGLERKKDENGIYEPVSIKHSWNAPQRYTNYLLFKLQRHSDHHANVYKPYQILCSYEDSPALPNGYSASLLTAFVPQIWFSAINPLVKAYNEDRKLSKEEESRSRNIINTYLFCLGGALTAACFLMM